VRGLIRRRPAVVATFPKGEGTGAHLLTALRRHAPLSRLILHRLSQYSPLRAAAHRLIAMSHRLSQSSPSQTAVHQFITCHK